jgi:excisionase family DNA binding protein
MTDLPNKPHLLPHEIQSFLGLSRSTLYRYLQRGIIPAKQIGDAYRIPRDKFLEWYDKQWKKGPDSEFLSL